MPRKAVKNVIADSTDPATTRPDLPPEERVGTGFIPMDLPYFSPSISLPPGITPIDAWGLFLMFFSKEQIRIICENVNQYMELKIQAQIDDPELGPHARIRLWRPITVPEAYGYLGIRIYIGIHRENQAKDYWKLGSN
jgi:hypothetical protein